MTTLIVTDAEPLIVLARAGMLDALLRQAATVVVPDIVRIDLIDALTTPSARAANWIRTNEGEARVRVVSTEAFEEFVAVRRERPATIVGKRAEQAAAEVLAREIERGTSGVTLLVADANAGKENFLVPLPEGVAITCPAALLCSS